MAEVTACGGCGSRALSHFLDMGLQPLAERMTEDAQRYPLRLVRCRECTLVQLSYIVSGHEVFPPDHPYATGNTRALRMHFAALAGDLSAGLSPGDLVADIGANDGTLITDFGIAFRRVAVEPTDQARKIPASVTVYREFFTAELGHRIRGEHGPAAVVTACNVLAHVPDPHDFLEGVAAMLGDGGIFVTENHDLASITGGLQIDTVYHEHLRYYSVTSLSCLLAMHGLEVFRADPIPTHGGSFRAYARAGGSAEGRAHQAGVQLHSLLSGLHGAGQQVYGVGAATRATPLIHYAGIAEFIACVCEVSSSEKIGHVMPGTRIPVVDEARLIEDQPAYALLFAWHIADSLIPRLRSMGYRGRFIIPLPEAVILDD